LIAATDADALVLLEGGALVGPGWLDYLLAALAADERNGLAGPSTNRSWNEQGAFRQAGGSLAEVARTAAEARRRFGAAVRTLEPLYSLADFCYVVRREVVEAAGAADESYGLGPCWEMDYNIRAARAGFQGVWACSAYVHRAPVTARRQREEAQRFEASKQRYQDNFCGLRLRGQKTDYRPHCRGDACPNFAPAALIQLRLPLPDASRQAQTTTAPLSCPCPPEPRPPSAASSMSSPSPANETLPLVSCIMPTYNRRPFVAQAIAYFLRQDYPNRELIIVDDGTDPVGDLVPDDTRIRYLRLPYKSTLGAKRNLSCRQAQGEIIAHWDDDDWHAPHRLRYQVGSLLEAGAEVRGITTLLFYDLQTGRAW
jgi:GT2 family glycosyltransferase